MNDNINIQQEIEYLNNNVPVFQNNNSTKCTYEIPERINLNNKFSTFCLNIRSLDRHGSEFKLLLNQFKTPPDCIMIQETWGDTLNFNIKGYKKFILKRKNKRGGGVGIFIKEIYNSELITEMSYIKDTIEVISIKFSYKHKNFIYTSLYRPPSLEQSILNEFNLELKKILELKITLFNNSHHTVGGDFNINLNNEQNRHTIKLIQTFEQYNLLPNFTKPTRIHNNSNSLIDNIFSNEISKQTHYIIPSSISDHFLLIFVLDFNTINKTIYSKVRIINDENKISYINTLKSTNFDDILNDNNPQSAFTKFFNIIDPIVTSNFPIKNIKIKNNSYPWLNQDIIKDIKKEKKLYLKAKSTFVNIEYHKNKHKEFKQSLAKKIRKAKTKYHEKFIKENKNDSKKIWNLIKEESNIINKDTIINEISYNNNNYTNPKDIANALNKHFTNIGVQLVNNMDTNKDDQKRYLDNLFTTHHQFKFQKINQQELIKINKTIKNKKSSGPDSIPTVISKITTAEIPHVMTHLINLSLENGFVHNRLKEATIIPLFKSGSMTNPNNYRPISLINSFSKIVEKIVSSQLKSYFEEHSLFFKQQFGFRNGISTSHAMIYILNLLEVHNINKSLVNAIFIDLTKAFDCCSHDILLLKLEKYGINNIELQWFKNYLKGRKQNCLVNDFLSDMSDLLVGVPQGSILGPILFLIFINDYHLTLNDHTKSCLFADDTELSIHGDNQNSLNNNTKCSINKTINWFNINKLTINSSKTKCIKFFHNHDQDISIKNTQIEVIHSQNIKNKSFKFLGFHINEKLDFKDHKLIIIQKLNYAIHLLRRLKNTFPSSTKLLIYHSTFTCHINYGIVAWSRDNKLLERIFILQKKAIRLIANAKYNSHTEHLFKRFNILKLHDLIEFNRLLLAHSIKYKYCPRAICDIIDVVQPHNRLRRNLNNFIENNNLKNSLFQYIIPNTWNKIKEDFKLITNHIKFKKTIKKDLISKYSNSPNCGRRLCYVCNI